MGVVLYRRVGETNEIELKRFNSFAYEGELGFGWNLKREDCFEKEERKEEKNSWQEKFKAKSKEEKSVLNFDNMPEKDLRLAAKEKRIKNWHNKKIDNLISELKSWQPET